MKLARRTLLAVLIASSFGLVACGQKSDQQAAAPADGSAPAAAAEVKEIVVGSDASYRPFEFQNDQKEVVGFDVEVLKAAAEKSGLKVKFINTPWEGIFQSLQNGDRDILASAITITDERRKSMDFSDPYFDARQLIAVAKGVTDIKTFDDLKNKKVAVQTGTTGDEVVQKLLGKTSPNIKRFESMPLALKELENGGVQAAVGDNGVVVNYVQNNPGNGISTVEDTKNFVAEQYGFAVKKGNQPLLDKVNSGLKAIKSDGTYDNIYKKYFGAK